MSRKIPLEIREAIRLIAELDSYQDLSWAGACEVMQQIHIQQDNRDPSRIVLVGPDNDRVWMDLGTLNSTEIVLVTLPTMRILTREIMMMESTSLSIGRDRNMISRTIGRNRVALSTLKQRKQVLINKAIERHLLLETLHNCSEV